MSDELAKVVLIAGPTASGKSGAALALAERLGAATVVNADSMQVYRDLRVLSARPSPADEARARHALYGVVDGAERHSSGRWARAAADAIEEARARGEAAVVVGGTGLYFRALTDGLSPVPDISGEAVAAAEARRAEIGPDAFRAETIARDPAMAKHPAGDAQRMVRAWSVHEETGAPLSDWRARPGTPLVAPNAPRVVIEPDRAALYGACEARFDRMLAAGAVAEVEALLARGLDPSLPVMKALGVADVAAALAGAASWDEAAAAAKTATRRFAKRQLTWFRNQAADWPRAASAEAAVARLAAAVGA